MSRFDGQFLVGLSVVLLILLGAIALYWAPPAPPPHVFCSGADQANRWCFR